MAQFLEGMFAPDNQHRAAAEVNLMQAAAASPDQFVLLNLEIIEDASIPVNIRSSSIIVLKKVMSLFSENKIKTYLHLSESVREQFRRKILILLSQMKESLLRDKIADLIAEVASSIIAEDSLPDEQKWPNLLEHLFELYSTGNVEAMISVFRILEGLFSNVAHHFTQYKEHFYKIFEAGFNHTNHEVKVAVKLACSAHHDN